MNKFALLLFLILITCCGKESKKSQDSKYSLPDSSVNKEKSPIIKTPNDTQITSKLYNENELPKSLKVKSEVLYKTEFYNKVPKELVSEDLLLNREKAENHDGYSVRINDNYIGGIYDLVPKLDISQINFSKLKKVEQYIELFGDYKDMTDAWGDDERWHFTKMIRKIAFIDGKPFGISIFLHVSKGKGQKDTDVDEAIVKIIK